MSIEQLWAGWRSSYVASVSGATTPASPLGNAAPAVAPRANGAGEAPGRTGTTAAAGSPPEGSAVPAAAAGLGSDLESCVFCRIASAPGLDEEQYVVWRGRQVLAVLNAYPYAPGHLLVMPLRHLGELESLSEDEAVELGSATRLAARGVKASFVPDGLNIGLNLGRAAGAGIPGHLHVHVVPRWLGDTNFMTAVASVRVLPEALADSWAKLRAAWPSTGAAR